MSKAIRRNKKLNSENDNLFIYDEDTVATIGPVPYDSCYDYGKNGASHITENLYFSDNNFFARKSYEANFIRHTYRI